MTPRWYQSESVDAALSSLKQSPLIVLPTGSGKSVVIAELCKAIQQWQGRAVILAHRKELLSQNAEKLRLAGCDAGIFSAGLNQYDSESDFLCAGIQSIYKRANEIGRRDVVIVDESHLIPPDGDGMYQQFLRELRDICHHACLVGLTATPYRCGSGPLAGRGRMFSRIAYEVPTGRLIEEGFLCPLTNKPAAHQTDTSAIKVRGGEFVQSSMAAAFAHSDEVTAAVREVIAKTQDRKSVLVFCAGVDHAEHVAELLGEGVSEWVPVVTGNTPPLERQAALSAFQRGECRFLCNCDVLTTGFDSPRIDCVAVLRATQSPGLFAQIVGRGLRIHDAKSDCLILDFGGNLKRHGSLDDPNYGRAAYGSSGQSSVEQNGRGKECLNCGIDVPVQSPECDECGFTFPVIPRHESTADDESDVLGGEPEPVTWQVEYVDAIKHHKRNNPDAPPSLRVMYTVTPVDGVGGDLEREQISEWVCFEHEGFARQKAESWWRERSETEVPDTVDEALMVWLSCRQPERITTLQDGRWNRITLCEFEQEIPDEWCLAEDLEEVPF